MEIEGVNVIDLVENKITLELDLEVYPLSTIHAAAYVFVDRAYFIMDKKDGQILVTLISKGEDLEKLKNELYNELLNYNNYFTHLEKNKDIVRLIVERALFSANPSLVEDAEKQEIQNLLKELEQEEDPEIKQIVKELQEEQASDQQDPKPDQQDPKSEQPDPNFIPVENVRKDREDHGRQNPSQPQ